MKYIDAEKLRAEIERLKSILTDPLCSQGNILGPDWVAGGNKMLNEISSFITTLQQEQPEGELFECPETPIKDAIDVTSRMKYIDEELKPIAEFIIHYASWNLHKNEWNQPVIEVPLFRVLDALTQRGKPYCEG